MIAPEMPFRNSGQHDISTRIVPVQKAFSLFTRRSDDRPIHGFRLSVSADRIAHVAFRCAALLAELDRTGIQIDRSGVDGSVVEIYPAGSLRMWKFRRHKGYKKGKNREQAEKNRTVLGELVAELTSDDFAPWLDLGKWIDVCPTVDDAFDAVIASLTARAAALGLATKPETDAHKAVAKVEGWIRLPHEGSLARLYGQGGAARE